MHRILIPLLLAGALSAAELQVLVTSQGVAEGTIQLALFDDPDAFPDAKRATRIIRLPHTPPETRFVIPDLKPGRWAIAGYHDENDDGVCQTFMMIPREPWGLSNAVRPRLSPPGFKECAFQLQAAGGEHRIEMR